MDTSSRAHGGLGAERSGRHLARRLQQPHCRQHSESSPPQQCTEKPVPGSAVPDPDIDQINLILDTIRLNLSNVLRTWGRESRQYQSAVEIMESYLTENVERLKGEGRGKDSGVIARGGGVVGEGRPQGSEVIWQKRLQRGLEELMRDLNI